MLRHVSIAALAFFLSSCSAVRDRIQLHHGYNVRSSAHNISAEQSPADPSIQANFERIYANGVWGAVGRGSGLGSEPSATIYTQRVIQQVVNEYQVKSLVDAPCGALAWQPQMLEAIGKLQPDFRYLGLDVVRNVVAENQRRFAHEPKWAFDAMDFTQAPLPSGYELILCRDALQHLPLLSIVAALENFAHSNARLLLVGSYMRVAIMRTHGIGNQDITAGDVFDIDLMQAPFGLNAPLMVYNELTNHLVGGSEPDKHLLLYSIEALRGVDWGAMRERAAALAAAQGAAAQGAAALGAALPSGITAGR